MSGMWRADRTENRVRSPLQKSSYHTWRRYSPIRGPAPSPTSDLFRKASSIWIAALVSDEVGACLDAEIGVLSSFAAREWVKSCVQDPEALMRLSLLFQRKETEEAEADDHEQTDDDERTP